MILDRNNPWQSIHELITYSFFYIFTFIILVNCIYFHILISNVLLCSSDICSSGLFIFIRSAVDWFHGHQMLFWVSLFPSVFIRQGQLALVFYTVYRRGIFSLMLKKKGQIMIHRLNYEFQQQSNHWLPKYLIFGLI